MDTKCAKCGSTEHATEDCPQGILDSKCTNCGSTEHATDDCPHGILDSKCAKCGSTEHATNDCPHGILDTKCAHCGSKDHSTEQCPHLNQRIPDSDADAADAADAADNGSLWEKIQDKALFIGAAIGAILGLINAFESATDIAGYLIYTGIGAVAGGVLGTLLVKMLPWGIALGAVILILKACGVEI